MYTYFLLDKVNKILYRSCEYNMVIASHVALYKLQICARLKQLLFKFYNISSAFN